jgi:hypothetical protein
MGCGSSKQSTNTVSAVPNTDVSAVDVNNPHFESPHMKPFKAEDSGDDSEPEEPPAPAAA